MPKEIFFTPALDSTQLEAQRLLQETYLQRPAGVLFHVTTSHQTAGRGRFTRTWEDQPGTCSLTSTVVKLPNEALENAHWLTIVAALSVTETVRDFFPSTQTSLKLKWPNDVLFQGAKLGGILATVLSANDPDFTYVSLGVGVNLLQDVRDLPTAEATSLAAEQLTPLPSVADFNERFLTVLTFNLERFAAANWDGKIFQAAYQQLLTGLDQPVRVTHLRPEVLSENNQPQLTDATDTYDAIFLGVSAQGWALVRPLNQPGAVVEISSADITFAPTQSLNTPVTPEAQEAK
ncbi:MAG: biotin--[acetyl-CoA-carboxylase] ligase [Actinomycetaceae bacterium]|nr:biotin--[acetyl-CoA-carboxylase] ligase [Actinomycetaceae bacterium]